MAARGGRPRRGARVSKRGGPLVPLVGVCAGVVALTAAVTLGGEDSSSTTAAPTGAAGATNAAAPSAAVPNTVADAVALPPVNTCALMVGGLSQGMSLTEARTLTQIAAVGWQVKAPEEMVARVLDVAAAKPNQTPTVTDALDLFTREDSAAPSAEALAELRALTEPGGLTCVFDSPTARVESKGRSGLTPRTEAMRQGVIDAFGRLTMSGYGGKAPKNSPEAAGRALNVAVPETTLPGPGAGWVLAHWLTARGADYKLAAVAYADRVWAPSSGWRTTAPGQPSVVNVRPGRVYVAVVAGSAAKAEAEDGKKAAKNRKRS